MSLRSLFSHSRSTDGAPQATTPSPLSDDCRALVAAYNALGRAMLERLGAQESQNNCLISPLSIAVCLTMTQIGAARTTRDEMTRLLGIAKLSETAIDEATQLLLASLRAASDVELRVANSLWVNKNIQLEAPFARRCQQSFDARAQSLDFAAPESVGRINDWVGVATNDKINRIIEKLQPLDRLFLINAVYFRGDWLKPFEKRATQSELFHAPKSKIPVAMMNRHGDFRYLENSSLQMVSLPYGGERFSLYLLLPRPISSLTELFDWMNPKNFEAAIAKMQKCAGHVSLPRFKTNYTTELSQCLHDLGMRAAFDEHRADFSPMSVEPLHVGAVIHKTVFELDETGTEAAAVTAVKMVQRLAAPEPVKPFAFIANRPFALVLRDDWSGAWLFAGAVNAPSDEN